MRRTIGVLVMEHIAVGLVQDNKVVGPLGVYPQNGALDILAGMPADSIGDCIKQQIESVAKGEKIDAIGLGFPGIISHGVVEDSPNLQQVKGFHLQAALSSDAISGHASVPVRIFNDADAMAAGIAAARDKLHKLIRVWTLGNGVGFGRYPWAEGIWEGGHSVVTLDPKENLCGCGGRGHLEGILGHRSMRMRFLDLEPEEVFANAAAGDARCAEFLTLGHRALAAATATSIHMEGPGQFYITGPNAKFIDIGLLDRFVHEMIKMSPLQGSRFEVIPTSDEVGVIGAAVNAERTVLSS
ncbi:MAG TPA: ROK family protein [Bryobacteraceae bacterium]|jgi:glucokinase|nr:ROK family protein [Bryobacteraceae bacterium]